MKVGLIQQHATGAVEDNLRRGVASFRQAVRAGAELVAFAELSFLPFLPQKRATAEALARAETIPGPTVEVFSRLARESGVVTIINLLERSGEKTYDASPVIDADGRIVGVVRMAHVMEGPGFHERGYYSPGDCHQLVFATRVGRVGIAVCYDRHFPEYMRALAVQGAEIVVIPQAGAVGEWTPGLFEAEVQVAAFQNGYFAALVNRVGREEVHVFAGQSFVADPDGRIIARAPEGRDFILLAECDLTAIEGSFARRHFLPDRRPEYYRKLANDGSPE